MYKPLINTNKKPNLPKFETEGFEDWVTEQLEKMLGLDQVSELVKGLLEMQNEDELKAYINVRQSNSFNIKLFEGSIRWGCKGQALHRTILGQKTLLHTTKKS